MSSDSYSGSNVELPTLPDGWVWKRVRELVDSSRGICYGIVQPGKHDLTGIPMVNTGDVFDGHVASEVTFKVSKELDAKFKRSKLRGGELLVTLVGANFGRVAIAPQAYAGFNCSRAVGVVPVVEDAKYTMIALRSPLARHLMDTWANTTAQPTFNLKDLGNLPIPLPPHPEKRAITELVCSLDDRITLLRETNKTLESIAQAIFKSWFVDFDPVRAKMEGRQPEGMDEATAAQFPDSFEESELGLIPGGWKVNKFSDFIKRLSVGKKFDQKTALTEGNIPILDQGKSGIIGYHNELPGVQAGLENPVVVFANHTCYMRLITFNFSAIQNVLPFIGQNVDTIWAYFATKDKIHFSEYKGHWPEFSIIKAAVPSSRLTEAYRLAVHPLISRVRLNEEYLKVLNSVRDTLLPRLISGQLRLPHTASEVESICQ